jgi:adenylate cyclase
MYQVDILIGAEAAALVRDAFHLQDVDLVQVAGKSQPVETYAVLGEKGTPLPPAQREFLDAYEAGIAAFRSRDFAEARKGFERALALQPGNYLARQYFEDASAFITAPPEASWTGARVMTKK